MEITLIPEDSGKNTYTNRVNCPIARALRRKGLWSVYVTPYTWFGMKWFVPMRGNVCKESNNWAYEWSNHKQEEPRTITL